MAERWRKRAEALAASADMEVLYAASEKMDAEEAAVKENESRAKSLLATIIDKLLLVEASPAGTDLDEQLTGRHDTHAGLHATALGGAWQAAVFGFGGVHLSDDGLRINPNLPTSWQRLRFNLVLRGEVVWVEIDQREIALRAGQERAIEVPIRISGQETWRRMVRPYSASSR